MSEGTASISLEIPGVKLQVHHGAEHGLCKATVKVMVEALDARDDKARRQIFRYICVGAHAEGVASVVCQPALVAEHVGIEDEILALTLLVADAGSQVASRVPVSRELPWLGHVDAEVGIVSVAGEARFDVELFGEGVPHSRGKGAGASKNQRATERECADPDLSAVVEILSRQRLCPVQLERLQNAGIETDAGNERLEGRRLTRPSQGNVGENHLGAIDDLLSLLEPARPVAGVDALIATGDVGAERKVDRLGKRELGDEADAGGELVADL